MKLKIKNSIITKIAKKNKKKEQDYEKVGSIYNSCKSFNYNTDKIKKNKKM